MAGSFGRQRVQNDVLEDTEILLPPIEEQEKIANILSSLDYKIELNNEMNKTLEEMAKVFLKDGLLILSFQMMMVSLINLVVERWWKVNLV